MPDPKPAPDTVENARYVVYTFLGDPTPRPFLYVTLDGQEMAIEQEQKLLVRWGVAVLNSLPEDVGEDYYNRFYAVLPAEGEGGRKREIVYGATADRRVVALTRRFWRDLDVGEFRPGRKLEIPDG